LLASASAKSSDNDVGVLATGVCPKAEHAVASTSVVVNKGTTFIRKLQSQMQFKAFAKKHADTRANSAKVECESGAN
jgi:hypothetical protein